jgi:hypothetical protein
VDELANQVVSALRNRDSGLYSATLVTMGEATRHCPALAREFDKKFSNRDRELRDAFENCQRVIDWSKAEVLGTAVGNEREPAQECDGTVIAVDDAEVSIQVGDVRHKLLLRDVARIPEGIVLGMPPACD